VRDERVLLAAQADAPDLDVEQLGGQLAAAAQLAQPLGQRDVERAPASARRS
jgi:hypothetical protein